VLRKRSLVILIPVLAIIGAIACAFASFNIAALPQPGRAEIWIASHLREWYVSRGAARVTAKPPPHDTSAVSAGDGTYGMACAFCHGKDGGGPTNIGKAMHPRVEDLRSRRVQKMSDREMFWVVKNGIRFTGMPGFGHSLSDDEIWQVTYYVRTLGKPSS
jgi:mono/diheme cytochrome c family protein